jgi:FkbM family methyltransferase
MKIKPGDSSDWYKKNGDNTYRIDYNFLNKDSIVVDIGARHGNWSDNIRDRYKCNVHCFEVVPEFCQQLINKGYIVYPMAVIDYDGKIDIGIDSDEGSIFHSESKFEVNCIGAKTLFELVGNKIELMKINVEGAEYRIINNIIDSGLISNVKSILVQFHIIDNTEEEYIKMYDLLSRTHKLTWRFPFVWENWELK